MNKTNTRDNFKTNTQYQRWLDYQVFFNKIIYLQKSGKEIFYQNEKSVDMLGKISFRQYENEVWIVEEITPTCTVTWVGWTHDLNKATNEYDFIHIDNSLVDFKKIYNFKYYENEIKV